MTLLLWLTTDQLRAWHHRTRPPHSFSPTPEGHAAFAAYLTHHADCRWRLMLDLPGEEHVELPASPTPLSWFDRRAFLQQRLRDCFPERALRAVLEHPVAGRQGPWWLTSADSQMLAPWLDILQTHGEQAAGIHPLSALLNSSSLIPPRFSGALQILADGILRQFILFHGQPRFSRQIPLPAASPPAALVIDESHRLLQHLRLHAASDNANAALLLIPPALSDELPPQRLAPSGADWEVRPCSPEEWQQALLQALQPSRHSPTADLSPPELRRAARRARRERWSLVTSSLLLAASLGLNGHARNIFDNAQRTLASTSLAPPPPLHGILPAASAELLQEMLARHADASSAGQALAIWASQPEACHTRLLELAWHWPQRQLQVLLAAPTQQDSRIDCSSGTPLTEQPGGRTPPWHLHVRHENQR